MVTQIACIGALTALLNSELGTASHHHQSRVKYVTRELIGSRDLLNKGHRVYVHRVVLDDGHQLVRFISDETCGEDPSCRLGVFDMATSAWRDLYRHTKPGAVIRYDVDQRSPDGDWMVLQDLP